MPIKGLGRAFSEPPRDEVCREVGSFCQAVKLGVWFGGG